MPSTVCRGELSAFVVSFNRAPIIGTCLRSLSFADELIVVDKSSTDATPAIAAGLADRVVRVPWSPTVEATRAFAAEQCTHEWIVFLDDDECLSPQTAEFLRRELAEPRADAYALPLRHYILGQHDERAYYWPEHHIRCFRRGAVAFGGTVHAGIALRSDRVLRVPPESGVCIHHLSHQDTAQWLEKTNRYTSRPDRARVAHEGEDLIAFAHARIEHWLARTRDPRPGGYPTAVALLRATYDLIDRLKVWEEEQGLDGAARFQALCTALDAGYGDGPRRPAAVTADGDPAAEASPDEATLLRRTVRALRAAHDAGEQQMHARRVEAERRIAIADAARREAEIRAARAAAALQAIEASTFWRATALPRRVVRRLRSRR